MIFHPASNKRIGRNLPSIPERVLTGMEKFSFLKISFKRFFTKLCRTRVSTDAKDASDRISTCLSTPVESGFFPLAEGHFGMFVYGPVNNWSGFGSFVKCIMPIKTGGKPPIGQLAFCSLSFSGFRRSVIFYYLPSFSSYLPITSTP